MIPMAPHIRFYQIWRIFVKSVQLFPHDKHLARQACTAQALYVIYEAIGKQENQPK